MAVIDCTGHGVPGAFMTMIASSGLRRIIKDEGCHDPATILKQLNFIVKTSLQQDKKDTLSDDGLDAAICFISDCEENKGKVLTYAGAKIPLFYVENNEVNIIKGDRQSIGYKRSDLAFNFTNHTIKIEDNMSFYLSTDGFIDQLGGDYNRRFGTAQFRKLIKENAHLSFERQRKVFIRAFNEYKGANERRDDVTVIGFTFRK
jgi:serine phosphatase RsbU (regulator of sigma subunit)